jgi:hypothetical protein
MKRFARARHPPRKTADLRRERVLSYSFQNE